MKCIIGYYKKPADPYYRVYVQDMSGYEYLEDFTVSENDSIMDIISNLKKKYPNSNVCEFKY